MQTTFPRPETMNAAPPTQAWWKRGEDCDWYTALLGSAGPFDEMAAQRLERDVQSLVLTGCRSFILDLRHCDSVDPRGAWGLLSLRSEVSRRGGQVRLLLAEGSGVGRMLRLLRFGALFPIIRAGKGPRQA
jgi:hypothetical protein